MEEDNSGLDHIETVEDEIEGRTIKAGDSYFIQPLFTKELTGAEWTKFINNIKSLVRSSPEYKAFVGYCKNDLDLRNCSFLSGVIEEDKVTVEMHHSPFTIHDVIEIIVDHMMEEGPITTMMVCQEVMRAHFFGLVGVIPLSETVHELVHAGKINIDIRQTYGDTLEFIKRYNKGVKTEHLEKLKTILEVSERKLLHDENLFETDVEKWLGSAIDGQETLKFLDSKLEPKEDTEL